MVCRSGNENLRALLRIPTKQAVTSLLSQSIHQLVIVLLFAGDYTCIVCVSTWSVFTFMYSYVVPSSVATTTMVRFHLENDVLWGGEVAIRFGWACRIQGVGAA